MIKQYFYLTFIVFFVSISSCSAQKELSNESIWSTSDYRPKYVYSVNSMKDGEHFSLLENNKIVEYAYQDFGVPTRVILDLNTLLFNSNKLTANDYTFNADETKVLIATEKKSIYRRSYTARYFIVDLNSMAISELARNAPQELADFSPDGRLVAYVQDNNLFYYDIETKETTQVTSDGQKNRIINGGTDWVYEEEFAITKGFYWSNDSKKIAYYQFDETDVPEYIMPLYLHRAYPFNYTFKYPKAGEQNSKLSVNIYELTSKKSFNVINNSVIYEYFPRMTWTNSDELCILGLNRHQNNLSYMLVNSYNAEAVDIKVFHTDVSDTYVEIDDNLIFLSKEEALLRTSEKDGFNHIYKIGLNGKEKQITSGKWDVIELKGVDEETGTVYYTSAEEGAIYETLYAISLKGKNQVKLSDNVGSNNADFSTGMKYYINYYSNANTPYLITLHKSNGKRIKVLEDNKPLNKTLRSLNLSSKEFITIRGEKEDLNASIIKPHNFDPAKRYPVYFNIYNGPGSNLVSDKWQGNNYMFHQLLASKGYIVISVDTRGTMYRGAKFKKSTYLQLGKLETEDMIAVAKEVGKWDFVDSERIGVQGWSYGGYMTALCMTKGAEIFKMGIAVAPVTNWRWYDNIYTERFMRTPQENPIGYDDNSPINHVQKMKGNFLIVHGSGDDNVHLQNTMEMTEALVAHNILFDMAVYTNKNHSIYGGKTRLHLFNKILTYTLNNL
ncbi:MAG: S9 family peptidase [Putridiphycobacter sp.]|nr:S9 family peptidase [Putridiphycobacter sp.]